jgi:pimeloyl-ACP methyl ester carboxylesterase
MKQVILHFGGNGHSEVRLRRAREAMSHLDDRFELVDVPYPGFENRARSANLNQFLADLEQFVAQQPHVCVIASGIGALIALSLRAQGGLLGSPMIFQGPVLWGLEHRWMPRVMRWQFPRFLLKKLFTLERFQDRFVGKQFQRVVEPEFADSFFQGYADCTAFGDLFDWFTPQWLRQLELAFQANPDALNHITVWICGADKVVGRFEIEMTSQRLPISWPIVEFPTWGHYPAIDAPEEWAKALKNALS